MKVLITGSYGQLGNELKRILEKRSDIQAFFTDVDTLDICNYHAVKHFFTEHKPNFVINCAAYTAVDKAENEVELCYKINSNAVRTLAIIADRYRAKIVHISTDYVFDGTTNKPYKETFTARAKSVYGKSKLLGEKFLNRHAKNSSVIIRTSWLYSAFGNNFVKTMLKAGKDKKRVSVVFDQTGTPTNAADLAAAIVSIIDSKRFAAGIYHFSNEGVCSWYDFAKAIFEIKNIDCKVLPVESEQYPVIAQRPAYSVLNKQKIKDTYGIQILHWRESLSKYLIENFD